MGGPSGAFSGDDENGRMITDINVTPLVDIVLVLLIVFMVTASFIVNPSIKVDLPKAASGTEQPHSELALVLKEGGDVFLNGNAADEASIQTFIGTAIKEDPELQAIIAADKNVPHGDVVHMIDVIKKAGIRRFAINVEAAP